MGFRSVRDAYLRRYGVFKAISAEFDKKVRFFHRFQSKNVIFCCSIIVVKWMDRFLHVMSHPKYSYFWLRKVVHTIGKLIRWTKNISSPWDVTLIFDKIFTIFKAFCSTYVYHCKTVFFDKGKKSFFLSKSLRRSPMDLKTCGKTLYEHSWFFCKNRISISDFAEILFRK